MLLCTDGVDECLNADRIVNKEFWESIEYSAENFKSICKVN